MKKIALFVFIVGIAMQLSACGSSGSSTQVVNNPPPTILASVPSSGDTAPEGVNVNTVDEPFYPDFNRHLIAADATGMARNALQLAGKIKLGRNIGNTMKGIGAEIAWGNPLVSNKLLQPVKSSGFDAVRIPAAWDQYANQDTAEISQDWLNCIKQIVQECIDNELYVVLNIHWDGGWLENNFTPQKKQSNNAKQKAFGQQFATQLRDFDEHLIYASAKEPNVESTEQMDVLLSYHQTFVDAVRAIGGKNVYRVLVEQGPAANIEKTNKLFSQIPVDSVPSRLKAEVHFYTPYNFTLMQNAESWEKTFYYWGENNHSTTNLEHDPTWGEETAIDELCASIKGQFVDLGIPVELGEFSATRRTNLIGDDLQLHLTS